MPLTKILLTHVIKAKLLSRRSEIPTYGSWAVITGATDGIGKAYAEALASDGLNIVLISRSADKLNNVAKEINSEFKTEVKCIVADFTRVDIYEKIGRELKDLDIGCLVNNVGMSYPYPEYFDSSNLPDQLFIDMINCNINSAVLMTRIVLPGMISRGQGGAIINISSGSGAHYVPLLSVYSATKSFVDFFSRAIAYEVASQGVIVQTVLPFFVATKLSKIRRGSFMIPYPSEFVDSALNLFGVENRTFGCLAHALQFFFLDNVPSFLREILVWRSVSGLRKKALRQASSNKYD